MKIQKSLITIITIISILSLLILPLISAQLWGGYWGYSPLDYLENEWVMFTVLFLVFFAIIYYSINKMVKNPIVAMIVSLGISLFISLALSRRGLLWDYGYGLDSWILLGAAIIGIGFLLRFASESFGRGGEIISVIMIWLIINAIDPYQILPDTLLYSDVFMGFYGILKSLFGGILLIIVAILVSRERREESFGGQLLDLFRRRLRR
jgi:hypothetical protein